MALKIKFNVIERYNYYSTKKDRSNFIKLHDIIQLIKCYPINQGYNEFDDLHESIKIK